MQLSFPRAWRKRGCRANAFPRRETELAFAPEPLITKKIVMSTDRIRTYNMSALGHSRRPDVPQGFAACRHVRYASDCARIDASS
jgi:hypothetical protein